MTTTTDRAELESWRRLAEVDASLGSAVGRTLLDACNAIEALQAKLDKDHDELRDKRTDLLNIRGALSPQGRSLGLGPVVPMPLGKDVAPAVEWLVNEVDRLREENLQLRGVKATPDVWSRPLTDNERAFQDGV
jgi:hypothetical protein